MKKELLLLLCFFFSCGKTSKTSTEKPLIEKIDSNIVILSPNEELPSLKDRKIFSLSSEDYTQINTQLHQEIEKYNAKFKGKIKLENYKRQYIPTINEKGEKEVFVNCFCHHFDFWRKEIVFVIDGGECFFNAKINLSRNKIDEFSVNGEA